MLPVHVEALAPDGRWRALGPRGGATSWALDRPGAYVLGASPLRLRDDLGLFSRPVAAGAAEALLSLPEPLAPPRTARTGGADPVGDPEPDGLRAYVPGTPVGRIHWRSAARGGDLQERAFVTARQGLPLVVVDTAGVEDGPAVDWAARAAAGHVLALARTGGCRVLLPGDRAPTAVEDAAGGWAALHRRLAALAPGQPARPLDEPAAVVVRAAAAPEEAWRDRTPLPPGVVPVAEWSG
nr:DUF58 domain-containing protein [Patulibacter sp. SYSU D01012]